MPSLKPRIALAALAATLAVAGIGAGTADGRMAAKSYGDVPTFEQVQPPGSVAELEVFPTGDGPADEETCQGFESRLFAISLDLKEDMREGDGEGAVLNAEAMQNVEDMATEAGCAIIY